MFYYNTIKKIFLSKKMYFSHYLKIIVINKCKENQQFTCSFFRENLLLSFATFPEVSNVSDEIYDTMRDNQSKRIFFENFKQIFAFF